MADEMYTVHIHTYQCFLFFVGLLFRLPFLPQLFHRVCFFLLVSCACLIVCIMQLSYMFHIFMTNVNVFDCFNDHTQAIAEHKMLRCVWKRTLFKHDAKELSRRKTKQNNKEKKTDILYVCLRRYTTASHSNKHQRSLKYNVCATKQIHRERQRERTKKEIKCSPSTLFILFG